MSSLLIHPSLARGAARMTLREAHRTFQERLEETSDFSHIHSEKTARRMKDALLSIASDRLVFMRVEYSKKRSNLTYFGLDVRTKHDRPELGAFVVLSGNDETHCTWLKFRVSQHALERVQERRIGTALEISSFADEFAPAFLMAWVEGIQNAETGFAREERLLPTSTGALISDYDTERDGRIGVTWLALEQLRPSQESERATRLASVKEHLSLMSKGKRTGTFAGRRDLVETELRRTANYG